MKKKNFINYCGLLGVAALLSYTAAVGYNAVLGVELFRMDLGNAYELEKSME